LICKWKLDCLVLKVSHLLSNMLLVSRSAILSIYKKAAQKANKKTTGATEVETEDVTALDADPRPTASGRLVGIELVGIFEGGYVLKDVGISVGLAAAVIVGILVESSVAAAIVAEPVGALEGTTGAVGILVDLLIGVPWQTCVSGCKHSPGPKSPKGELRPCDASNTNCP